MVIKRSYWLSVVQAAIKLPYVFIDFRNEDSSKMTIHLKWRKILGTRNLTEKRVFFKYHRTSQKGLIPIALKHRIRKNFFFRWVILKLKRKSIRRNKNVIAILKLQLKTKYVVFCWYVPTHNQIRFHDFGNRCIAPPKAIIIPKANTEISVYMSCTFLNEFAYIKENSNDKVRLP